MATATKFSNLQFEMLKLFSNNVPDEQLFEIKLFLGKYFAQKATESMEVVWNEQNLTEQDMINWSNEHNRYSHSR